MAELITLELEGLMLERLIDIALARGAIITRACRPSRRKLRITCPPRSAGLVREIAEKYHIKCAVTGAAGFCALYPWFRKRWTALFAVAVACALCGLFLNRVWVVDISLKRGDAMPEGVYDTLERSGIAVGNRVSQADASLAAARLRALDGCANASVTREGVTVRVEIYRESPAPGLYEMDSPRDLVALCDGVVQSVSVKSGTPMVSAGDTVRRGQVLISGYERDSGDGIRDLGALGSVTARIWYSGSADAPIETVEHRLTGRVSTSAQLCAPWFTIPIAEGESFEHYHETETRAPVGSLFFPLYIRRAVRSEYEPVATDCDMDALKNALGTEALAAAQAGFAQKAPENAEIIDHWTDFGIIESDILCAQAVIEAQAEIAVTRGYLEGY